MRRRSAAPSISKSSGRVGEEAGKCKAPEEDLCRGAPRVSREDRGTLTRQTPVSGPTLQKSTEKRGLELTLPVSTFAALLLAWFDRHKRDLPWREDPDPYRVWLSEVMLQQTQVKKVVPYFERFTRHFPDLRELAAAPEGEVLALWSGLGYYSRAKNLRRAAGIICQRHGGSFPQTFQEAVALPGVGTYTAGAVLSIAYGLPFAVLDGNVRRVMARFLKLEGSLTGEPGKGLLQLLTGMVRDDHVAPTVSSFNQALMELGALVCLPRNPLCKECPLKAHCGARAAGLQEVLPAPKRSRPLVDLDFLVAVVQQEGSFLMHQNSGDGYLRGLWEFPRVEVKNGQLPLPRGAAGSRTAKTRRLDSSVLPEAAQAFRERFGIRLTVRHVLPPIEHRITFRRLSLFPAVCELQGRLPGNGFRWAQPHLEPLGTSSYVEKILKTVQRGGFCTPRLDFGKAKL